MRKKLIIFGIFLLLIGSGLLGWILVEKREYQRVVEPYKLKYSSETDEYLRQYNEWLQLPSDERTELPLVLDKDGKAKTEAELKNEQQERLLADMDKLASREMTVYPFADVFYGENWAEQVIKYKKRKEMNEFILTSSIVCASMGAAIVGWYLLMWIARFLIKMFSSITIFVSIIFEYLKPKQHRSEEQLEILNSPDMHTLITGIESKTKPSETLSIKNESSSNLKDQKQTDEPVGAQPVKSAQDSGSCAKNKPSQKSKNQDTNKKEETVAPIVRRKENPEFFEEANPLDNTLEELSQQVSAIREYTAFQQNRLEKLQDGYDWNIIRNFCLRIIRCIDNLDVRISRMAKGDNGAVHLKEVKDELIFALESSGIEQFEPEINSDYRGQEKYAEAVKNRQSCNDAKKSGKIAKVLRPGYHYFINDQTVKVIRPAQVKLFA